MFQRLLFALAISLFFYSQSALSSVQKPGKLTTGSDSVAEFQLESGRMKTLVPYGWEPVIGVLNTPLALLSKKGAQDLRAVIQIVPYGVKDMNDDLAKIKKDPDEFYDQKEDWLEGMDGESISYEPYSESVKDGTTVCSIGIKYKHANGHFLDKTWYVSSKSKELFYVKALIPLDQEAEHLVQANRVIASISDQN
jgi:hypothetical protein